ncbi:MAG: EAL domain-containing protein [Xenococcaceae cyanobacterium MO_234.B1]|nr:EAL domain-containing protein [Xenococcaceae cyanobacterium MO_234.B1]
MREKAIICVDDDRVILSILGEQLKRCFGNQYNIELIDNSLEVLDVWTELVAEGIEIPVIISDQNMAKMSGDKLLIELHKLYPQTLKILLTGATEAVAIRNLVNAGALYRYIPKPWDETDLLLTVSEALRSYKQEQQLAQQNQLLIATNQQLQESLSLLVATLEATADGILVVDNCGKVVRFNQKFADIWEISNLLSNKLAKTQVINLILQQLSQPYCCHLDHKAAQLNSNNYSILELKNGKIIECYSQIQKLQDQNLGRVWSFRDVTERQQAEKLIKHQAFHDTLTGLANRNLFNHHLTETLHKANKSQTKFAVIFFDLDRFKTINDSLGHAIGDLLLRSVVERLLNCLREGDLLSRWGGDEFTLLLPQINSPQDATRIAQRILDTLHPAFELNDHCLRVTSSIGIAIYPDHGKDAETLLKNADAALYRAKEEGRNNYQQYNSALNSQAQKLLKLETRLHYALETQEFVLYYQPIIDVITNRIVKVEALVRWQHPEFGLVSPNIFIPLAEENGAIIPIGKWILETACAQNRLWQKMGLTPLKVSVNLSPKQFQQRNLVSTVGQILARNKLLPSCLELEITETTAMQNTDLAKNIIMQFHDMGITLAMDDFGTGYCSLSYLKQFPLDTIKIDQSFIKNLIGNPEDIAIVSAILSLGQAFNINVVAEGVESKELRNFLTTTLQCRYMQGHYFSRPLSGKDLTKLLKHNILRNQVQILD